MAVPAANSGCRNLQALPPELLLEITKHITDFPTLNGLLTLLTAHNKGVRFLVDCQTEIFANIIRAGRQHKLSRVVTAVMTLRNHSATTRIVSMKGAGENFIYKYLRSDDRECDGKPHYLQLFSDPIATVRDIWSISEDIEALVQDFAQTRIVKPSAQLERPVSSAELHRIRRAFWYFQLCYELVHAEESMPSGAEDEAPSQRSRRVVHHRKHQVGTPCIPNTGWLYGHTGGKISPTMQVYINSIPFGAFEEFEAVRFHLASLINAFRYQGQGKSSLLSWQPALLQRLIKDFDHWQEDEKNPFDHLLVADLRAAHAKSGIANIEQWGWVIWDAERLRKRGLKPGSQDKISQHLFDKALRECEDAQFTYIDRLVAEEFRADVRVAEAGNTATGRVRVHVISSGIEREEGSPQETTEHKKASEKGQGAGTRSERFDERVA